MKPVHPSGPVLAGLCCALLGSCTSTSISNQASQVNDLIGWIERVHVESELARTKVNSAIAGLRDIVDGKFQGDAISAFARFAESSRESEEQAAKLREADSKMRATATPVFEQWALDVDRIANASMRQRSLDRMMQTQEQYRRIVTALDPALTTITLVNRGLHDHALFLGHDFNPSSVSGLKADVAELSELTRQLDARFAACLTAAQEYVNAYSLPQGPNADAGKTTPAAPPPGGAGRSGR